METIQGKDKIFFGTDRHTGDRIYLGKPTFDCGWYWSFGYLGNKNCHYHLNGYQSKDRCFTTDKGEFIVITEKRNINMWDALQKDYDLNPVILNNLWIFCELALSIYQLKASAELFHLGGSHMTTNPCKETIQNKPYEDHINNEVLPEVIQKFWDTFSA